MAMPAAIALLAAALAPAAAARAAQLRATSANLSVTDVGKVTPRQSFGAPGLPASFARMADECQCKFEGECTCKATLVFMDCVAKACSSGKCDCTATQYQDSCNALATSCTGALSLQCMEKTVSCSMQHSVDVPTTTTLPPETVESVLAELEALRLRKCELEQAWKDGWINADNRLRDLEPIIEGRLRRLEELGGDRSSVYMGCDTPPEANQTTAEPAPARAEAVVTGAGEKIKEGSNIVLAYLWGLLSLIILIICSYKVYQWHGEMLHAGKTPGCGWKSAACCLLCFCTGCGTCITICYPIDEVKK